MACCLRTSSPNPSEEYACFSSAKIVSYTARQSNGVQYTGDIRFPQNISVYNAYKDDSGNEDVISYMSSMTFNFVAAQITFDANGGSDAPSGLVYQFNVPFRLPATIPVRQGYVFAGWLPSRVTLDPEVSPSWRAVWYSTDPLEEEGGIYYGVDHWYLCVNNVLSPGNKFRRLRAGEEIAISCNDIEARFGYWQQEEDRQSLYPVFLRSLSRPSLYKYLICSDAKVVMRALWHRCTHKLIRDADGRNLLRGPDGKLLRDD